MLMSYLLFSYFIWLSKILINYFELHNFMIVSYTIVSIDTSWGINWTDITLSRF